MGLSRDRRLRRSRDIDAVRTAGRSWAHPLVILRAKSNGLGQTRFGFICGRRVGKAVVRNRVRRRLRELCRAAGLAEGWDVVLIARPAAADASFQDLRAAVADLFRRGRLSQASRPEPA